MAKPGKHTDDHRQIQSAEYIGDLTSELAKLARQSHLDLLAYLLDIASLEARTAASRAKAPSQEEPGRVVQAAQG